MAVFIVRLLYQACYIIKRHSEEKAADMLGQAIKNIISCGLKTQKSSAIWNLQPRNMEKLKNRFRKLWINTVPPAPAKQLCLFSGFMLWDKRV